MEKIKLLSPVLLSLFLMRLLITGASIGDSVAILSLSALLGYLFYLEHSKIPEVNKEVKDKLLALEERLNRAENKVNAVTLANTRR